MEKLKKTSLSMYMNRREFSGNDPADTLNRFPFNSCEMRLKRQYSCLLEFPLSHHGDTADAVNSRQVCISADLLFFNFLNG